MGILTPRIVRSRLRRPLALVGAAAMTTVLAAGCGADTENASSAGGNGTKPVTLRLGYFPNLTHATAIVGVDKGLLAKALGSGVTIKPTTFNAGPAAIESLFSGAVDATFIGPGPTVNAYAKSKGAALKVISGAASGGAALVVKPSITTPAQLRGKKLATPQIGNTQDVALRHWLKEKGFTTTTEGGGDVSILPQENSTALTAFGSGSLDGAWVPEPWATRMVNEGGRVLVDERDLWPGRKFVTTNLIVSTKFLKAQPEVVKKLVQGVADTTDYLNANPAEAQTVTNAGIAKLTGKPIKPEVLKTAWANITFTVDPLASTLRTAAGHAVEVGLIKEPDLNGLYDLAPLNAVLQAAGKPAVAS